MTWQPVSKVLDTYEHHEVEAFAERDAHESWLEWQVYARQVCRALGGKRTDDTRWQVARLLSQALDAGAPIVRLAQMTYLTPEVITDLAEEFRNG